MNNLSRRQWLAVTAASGVATAAATARAASFGNPDGPPQGAINANPGSQHDPGPRNPALESQFPDVVSPPATDVGDTAQIWASFNNAHKRIENGGWARQVTAFDFPVSTDIAGVNMRLSAGGIRELHWHLAAEWAIMTYGRCRVTVLDTKGRAYVQDVKAGDLWYFPAGYPHSLQGLGPDGCEFVIAFDDGRASEFNTLLLTNWLAHTQPELLAKNFAVPADTFKQIPLHDLYIFQGKEPGPLSTAQEAVASGGLPPEPFTFSLSGVAPFRSGRSGSLRIADSTNFKVSKTVAAVLETIKPGALRSMHWHPNADEWQYWISGQGRVTTFDAGPRVQTADFHAGDIGVVKRMQGHYIENTGTTDAVLVAVFRAPEYAEISLSDWLAHTPPEMIAQTLNLDPSFLQRFSNGDPGILPA
ncbi:MAG: oxalate decarboxylase [Acetobacteraceae bacterium]|jgi:oxalate decarboxylase|nr:oxalate decarboxylase [Acetobacteraceae bacterium]MEA2788421.1 oxalate decarboxylase [Acetobacteraceae bacterium]